MLDDFSLGKYNDKKLKKRLKEAGIERINILRKNFPHSTEAVKEALGVREGGTQWWAFTELNGKMHTFIVELP